MIAHPTEGLKENLSYAGIYIEKEKIEEWVEKIIKLKEDRDYYKKVSENGKKRSKELNREEQLGKLLKKIKEVE